MIIQRHLLLGGLFFDIMKTALDRMIQRGYLVVFFRRSDFFGNAEQAGECKAEGYRTC